MLKNPNSLRNRYRRYHAAWRAYGWVGAASFRAWARTAALDSYAAPNFEENFSDLLLRRA